MFRLRNFPNLGNVTGGHRRTSDGNGVDRSDNADDGTENENEIEHDTDLREGSADGGVLPVPPGGSEDQYDNDDDSGVRRRSPIGGDGDIGGREPSFWDADDDVVNEERRREAILNEIERSQRSNFFHFCLLCLIPTSLLLIVVASVLGENGDCSGYPTSCANEPRSFINAFTTRCICDAVIAEP
mmetsp:Transcript_11131/g.23466  ORF Transcript_11131/g.23466 Transcript_11131/m.23466 type:complete len:185 (-) Transcript_11131:147-701(-)